MDYGMITHDVVVHLPFRTKLGDVGEDVGYLLANLEGEGQETIHDVLKRDDSHLLAHDGSQFGATRFPVWRT